MKLLLNFINYTNCQRQKESGTKRFRSNMNKKKTEEVKKAEIELSSSNSKSSYSGWYLEYLRIRLKYESILHEFYGNIKWRIYRWWSYQNKRKSEQKLVQNIKKKLGDNIIIGYGTWSSLQTKGCMPSPTTGIRKLLAQHFTVINVPEDNTTKICCKCHKGKMCATKKRKFHKKKTFIEDGEIQIRCKEVTRDVRGLRRCNNKNCGALFSRDYNGAINIRKNLLYYKKHGNWNSKFMRKKKDNNNNKK